MIDRIDENAAYCEGFCCAAGEIREGRASYEQAKQRGLYPGDQTLRILWDQGYDAAVCAYRLGHDVDSYVSAGIYAESTATTAAVVFALLDGEWPLTTRPDPRGKP